MLGDAIEEGAKAEMAACHQSGGGWRVDMIETLNVQDDKVNVYGESDEQRAELIKQMDKNNNTYYNDWPEQDAKFEAAVASVSTKSGVSLRSLLQSEGRTRLRRKMSSGLVDPKAIPRHAAGLKSPRIFTRKLTERKSPTAVSILVDQSGSMCGTLTFDSMTAAASVAKAVDMAGHVSEITIFGGDCMPTDTTIEDATSILKATPKGSKLDKKHMPGGGCTARHTKPWMQKIGVAGGTCGDNFYPEIYNTEAAVFDDKAGLPYRTEFGHTVIIKPYHKRMGPRVMMSCSDVANHRTNNLGATQTGCAMYATMQRLKDRREERKILLTITDGSPTDGRLFSPSDITQRWSWRRMTAAMKLCLRHGIIPPVILIGGASGKHGKLTRLAKNPTSTEALEYVGEGFDTLFPYIIKVDNISDLPTALSELTKNALHLNHR